MLLLIRNIYKLIENYLLMAEDDTIRACIISRYTIGIQPLVGEGKLHSMLISELEQVLSAIKPLPVISDDFLIDKKVDYDEVRMCADSYYSHGQTMLVTLLRKLEKDGQPITNREALSLYRDNLKKKNYKPVTMSAMKRYLISQGLIPK